ncbi:MAG: ester cyclase [Actinomycetota bacterium]
MSDEHLVMLLRLVEDGFNTGRFDRLDEIFHPDVVVHAPFPVDPGVEGLRSGFERIREGFPDSHAEIDDFVDAGDRIYRRWTVTGTHTGTWFGIPPTGRRIEINGVDIERFEGGLIVEHWTIWDRMVMLEQLGLAPPMGAGS